MLMLRRNHYNFVSVKFCRHTSSLGDLKKVCNAKLSNDKQAGILKTDKLVVTGVNGSALKVKDYNNVILNFGSADCYGLSSHPKVKAAAANSLDRFGLGLCATRYCCGTQDVHKQLERRIAQFHDRDDAIVYPSCYHANIGLFNACFGSGDVIFSDEFNHASIISGLQLCRARKIVYKHKDMSHLERELKQVHCDGLKVIASDGVFSLLGTTLPLRDIYNLANEHKALIFVDDSHSTAVLGRHGRGTEEHFGLQGKVDIINSTIGKALGVSQGGYTTGPMELIDLLRQRSKSFRYSQTIPPAVAAAGCVAFDIMMSEEGARLRDKLNKNVQYFKDGIIKAGFKIHQTVNSPIVPVIIGDHRKAIIVADMLLASGIFAPSVTMPLVKSGDSSVRVQMSASHSYEDIEYCLRVFANLHGVLRS